MVLGSLTKSGSGGKEDFQSALNSVLNRLGIRELSDVQKLALSEGLTQGANLMVVAPSGSGKTLVGLMAVLKLLIDGDDNRKAVFLVPLKALAAQQLNYIRRALGDEAMKVAINTGDFSRSMNRGDLITHQVLVMTYERFDQLIRSKAWWLKRIRLIVIDEINYLTDKGRGPRLEATIVRLKESLPHAQLIALCPPAGNASDIADWLGCKLIVGDERPVPLHLDVVSTNNKVRSAVEISLKTISDGGSAIIFAYSRSKSEQIAFSLLEALQTTLTEKERAEAKGLSLMLLGTGDEILKVTKRLASVVQAGVAFHHAGLRFEDRNMVEEGFRNSIIKAVVCTTTLGAGINTPARTVIVTDTSYLDVESPAISSPQPLLKRIEPDRLHQMLGRAGRLGYDTVGYGVILVGNRAEEEFVKKIYFQTSDANYVDSEAKPKLPMIESRMNSDFALLEQLLIRIYEWGECSDEELLDFLSETFWWRGRTQRDIGISQLLRTDSFDAEGTLNLLLSMKKLKTGSHFGKEGGSCHDSITTSISRNEEDDESHPSIRIVNISRQRVEARVKEDAEGVWVTCSFNSKKGPRCDCAHLRLQKRGSDWGKGTMLCNHLVTLASYLLSTRSTRVYAEEIIVRALSGSLPLDHLLDAGLITIVDDKYRCTELGHIAATLYLHPLTVLFIKSTFEKLHTDDELDLESMINLALRALIIEGGEKAPLLSHETVARAIMEWINEESEDEILRSKAIAPGDLQELREELSRITNAASHIAAVLGLTKLSKNLSTTSRRVRYGVKEDLIPLIELSIPSVGRKQARKLYELGYINTDEIIRATSEELIEVTQLSLDKVTMIKEYVEKIATGRQPVPRL
nr:DEAD/DEAH box helicase [Candidatus Njordarchaeota archaeon]